MGARLIDGKWWLDYRWKGRRYRYQAEISTKRCAVEQERRDIDRLARGLPIAREEARAHTESCAEYFNRWVAVYVVNNKPSEAASKRSIVKLHLAPFFGREPIAQVNWPRRLDEFKAHQTAKGLEPKSINNHLTVLRKALATAARWKLIPSVPEVQWLRAPRPQFDFFDATEGARLLEAAAQPAVRGRPLEIGHEQGRLLVLVALRAGLRRGELLALRWEDVDLPAGKLLVRQSDYKGQITTPKGGRSREVPLSPALALALREHRHLRGPLVFSRQDGSRLTRDAIKHVVPSACRRAGLRPLQWHALRHSFASQLVMAGVPLKVVQELLGHATIEMTMRYAHLSPSTLVGAVALLDEVGSNGQQVGSEAKVLKFEAVK